jgi:hypothetical protein
MERRSFATLILTTVCFAACDSKPAPTDTQQEPPAPASKAPSSPAEPGPQPPPIPAAKQPPAAAQPTKPQKPQPSRGRRGGEEGVRSFAVYALSRGTGVPDAAREAQEKVQELIEFDRGRGVVVTIQATRIGIEGERRLCVTYADAQEAARALERVRAMVQGVDLVNVVVEPCAPDPVKSPTKEKP